MAMAALGSEHVSWYSTTDEL